MPDESMLVLAGAEGRGSDLLVSPPRLPYTPAEQQLSVFVQREIDHLLVGERDQLVLLKLYPLRVEHAAESSSEQEVLPSGVRREIVERMAADTLHFFGPLHGGIITQEDVADLIIQGQKFTTAYPHIILERHTCYDAKTSEPLLGAWRACRIQNQRRETQTNRRIDLALLALEVGQAVLPRLIR